MAAEREPVYRRVILKVSGEALAGSRDDSLFDFEIIRSLAAQIKSVHELGVQIALVVGGGNILRGSQATRHGIDRATADQMGMLATVINGLAVQDALENIGLQARTMTAVQMPQMAELYIRRRAVRHMEKGRVVILAAGTGNTYVTTDTAAALRAVELDADVVLMAKRVDAVYSADPEKDPTAVRLHRVGYKEAINRGLAVMDYTALTMCMENNVLIQVFDLQTEGNIERAVRGETIGTLVGPETDSGAEA